MELPDIGLGTWELKGEECTKIVEMALDLGYRHIDTAHLYGNHEAIKKAMKGFDRRELYLTSKLSVDEEIDSAKPKASVQKACERALKELGTDYLDLYLIHWPDEKFPLEEIFLRLEGLVKEGKIRHAGVSNYNTHHLERSPQSG